LREGLSVDQGPEEVLDNARKAVAAE